MQPIWVITSDDVIKLQGTDRFNDLLDDLLQAQTFFSGVPLAALKLNSRQEIADGGIDAVLEASISSVFSESL
jgi:hypothetical protein